MYGRDLSCPEQWLRYMHGGGGVTCACACAFSTAFLCAQKAALNSAVFRQGYAMPPRGSKKLFLLSQNRHRGLSLFRQLRHFSEKRFVEIRRSSSRLDPPKSVKSSLRKRAAATVPVVVQCLRGGRIDATYAARRRQLPAGTGTTTGARRLAIFAIVCGKSALCRHSPTLGLAGQRTQPCWRLKRCSACATVTRAK